MCVHIAMKEKTYNNKLLELKLLIIKAKKVLVELKYAKVKVKPVDSTYNPMKGLNVNWEPQEYWKNWDDY